MCLVCTATTDDAKAALLRRVALDCRSCPLLVLFPPGMTRLKRLICSSCPQLCALPEDMIHFDVLGLRRVSETGLLFHHVFLPFAHSKQEHVTRCWLFPCTACLVG